MKGNKKKEEKEKDRLASERLNGGRDQKAQPRLAVYSARYWNC